MSLPITVLMTVYNSEKFLKESIKSVLSQSFSNFEFKFLIFGLGEMETLSLINAVISLAYIVFFIFLTKVIFYKRDVV